MKTFLKSTQVTLANGGYVVGPKEVPVTHEAFIVAQKQAEYIVTLATMAKGKSFVDKKADSISDLTAAVMASLNTSATTYVNVPTVKKGTTTSKLASEALAFMQGTEDKSKAEKVNAFLQQFNVLSEFEEFGLYFSDDNIVKLNKIYTIKEIVSSVESVIDLLG